MNNKITKLAVAAIFVVAIMAGLSIIGNTGSVALANVLERVLDIRAYAYRIKTTDADSSDYTEFEMLISKDFGHVSKTYIPNAKTGQMELFNTNYAVSADGIMVTLIPKQKMYIEIKMADNLLKDAEESLKQTGHEPGSPILFLSEFIKNPFTELGTSEIDGVEVIGFKSTDLAVTSAPGRTEATVWVDAQTELPVRIEAKTYDDNDMLISTMTTYDFQWSLEVTQAEFTPVIPDDYQAMAEQLEFSADEKNVIAALRFFAGLHNGSYPKSLAVKQFVLSTQVQEALHAGAGEQYAGLSQDQLMKEIGQGCMDLEFTAVFYGIVASQNKAVAYYGDKVTADNPDAVLMRWRTEDNRYFVIFGDLTTKKVTEQALAELEAMPIK
jgi:hypothetical protein